MIKHNIFSFDSDQKGSVQKGTAFFYYYAISLDPGILKWISCQEYVKKRVHDVTAMEDLVYGHPDSIRNERRKIRAACCTDFH
nr:hypothetical protein [uncultured Desulfobacter sp.]